MAGNNNWVDDFNSFQQATESGGGPAGFSSTAGLPKKPQSRKDQIEAELKLLQWHKMANEAAIKAALLQTKSIRDQQPSKSPQHSQEDAKWMRRVIEQEHLKPLEVSKDFVLNYEKREKQQTDRLSTQVEKHISTLQVLKDKLEQKHDVKSRSDTYRGWQRGFSAKKQAVMLGKTTQDFELEQKSRMGSNSGRQYTQDEIDDEEIDRYGRVSQELAIKNSSSKELSTVLDSLNKLAELEKRITTLEKDNAYDQMLTKDRPAANERTAIEFKKKRGQQESTGPVGVTYAMKPKKTAWLPSQPQKPPAGSTRKAYPGRANEDTGFFLTEFGGENSQTSGNGDEYDNDYGNNFEDNKQAELRRQEELRRERQRQIALAPPGQKSLRSRVQSKKTRVKEATLGEKRHDDAMKELIRRRNEQQQPKKNRGVNGGTNGPTGGAVVNKVTRGAASGIKTKNRHLQELEKLKAGHQQRKLVAQGKVTKPSRPSIGNAADRVTSQTAPSVMKRGMPNTNQGKGNMTRRTDQPMRPPAAGVGGASTYTNPSMGNHRGNPRSAPDTNIAVAGVGGLRIIKEMRSKKK